MKKRVSIRGFFTCDIDVEVPDDDEFDVMEAAEVILLNKPGERKNLRLVVDDISDVRPI